MIIQPTPRHEIERINAISAGLVRQMNRKRAIDHFDCAVDGLLMSDDISFEEVLELLDSKRMELDVV